MEFEKPKNHWLHAKLQYKNGIFDFYSSDILNNPINDLIDSLSKVTDFQNSEVYWFLAPGGYYFVFELDKNELLFKILYSKDSSLDNKKELFY